MTAKKGTIISLSIDSEIQDRLKVVAKRRNVSVSKLVRDVVEKHLPKDDDEFDTIIFKIPPEIKKDGDTLRSWMNLRVEAVVKALTPS